MRGSRVCRTGQMRTVAFKKSLRLQKKAMEAYATGEVFLGVSPNRTIHWCRPGRQLGFFLIAHAPQRFTPLFGVTESWEARIRQSQIRGSITAECLSGPALRSGATSKRPICSYPNLLSFLYTTAAATRFDNRPSSCSLCTAGSLVKRVQTTARAGSTQTTVPVAPP